MKGRKDSAHVEVGDREALDPGERRWCHADIVNDEGAGRVKDAGRHRHRGTSVQNHPQWIADGHTVVAANVAHGERGIVGNDRARADDDGIDRVAQAMHEGSTGGAGDEA